MDFPVGADGKLALEMCTLDMIRDAYYILGFAYPADYSEDIDLDIEQNDENLRDFTQSYNDWVALRKAKIAKLNELLKDERCKDPSAINHNIQIQYAEMEQERKKYEDHKKSFENNKQNLLRTKAKIVHSEWLSTITDRRTLRIYAADKYHKDIAKPVPHPCALANPLYHDLVTDDIPSSKELNWEGEEWKSC